MASTITAEERAASLQTELVEASRLPPRQVSWVWDDAVSALIAAAIRDAEDAAYERAATMIEEGPLDTEKYKRGVVVAARFDEIAERIREFKSPSPPKDQGP